MADHPKSKLTRYPDHQQVCAVVIAPDSYALASFLTQLQDLSMSQQCVREMEMMAGRAIAGDSPVIQGNQRVVAAHFL